MAAIPFLPLTPLSASLDITFSVIYTSFTDGCPYNGQRPASESNNRTQQGLHTLVTTVRYHWRRTPYARAGQRENQARSRPATRAARWPAGRRLLASTRRSLLHHAAGRSGCDGDQG